MGTMGEGGRWIGGRGFFDLGLGTFLKLLWRAIFSLILLDGLLG